MIVSHLHRFIFAAVPKTGTHSVRQALRAHMGEGDMEQARLFVEKAFPIPELAALKHGHLSFQQVRPHLGETAFGDYFKFAFVRNPWDRFVSYCAFATSREGAFARDPKGVMRHFLFTAPPMGHLIFRPQHEFLVGPDGALQADYLGKVETMQASFDTICERIGIPTRALDHANKSQHADYRSYYDDDMIAAVARLYARDIALFGYEF
jgi:hypothetical protein